MSKLDEDGSKPLICLPFHSYGMSCALDTKATGYEIAPIAALSMIDNDAEDTL
ncbi:MAG TPA: hypothetical protein VKZ53_18515 [Candidatus Angelobacter sp.]|nr:hypothetical protein [Candidatus Angelobacter sp.]